MYPIIYLLPILFSPSLPSVDSYRLRFLLSGEISSPQLLGFTCATGVQYFSSTCSQTNITRYSRWSECLTFDLLTYLLTEVNTSPCASFWLQSFNSLIQITLFILVDLLSFHYVICQIWRSIYRRSYDCFPTYAGRTTSRPHRLLFTKRGACTTGVNMSAGS